MGICLKVRALSGAMVFLDGQDRIVINSRRGLYWGDL